MAPLVGRIMDILAQSTKFVEQTASKGYVQNGTCKDGLLEQREINERLPFEESLVEVERQQMATTIAASVGHELNNIATIICGKLELIQRSADDPVLVKKLLDLLPAQIHKIAAHASNLLTIGKPRTSSFQPILLPDLLDRCVALLTDSGILSGVVLCRDYQPNLPEPIGDVIYLQEVVINLIINATHAMGGRGTLSLEAKNSNRAGYVEFIVSDTGHGIQNEILEQIFLPYFTTKGSEKGTGLGLYIVKQIIEQQHLGYIEVYSNVGKGTSIIAGLPTS